MRNLRGIRRWNTLLSPWTESKNCSYCIVFALSVFSCVVVEGTIMSAGVVGVARPP